MRIGKATACVQLTNFLFPPGLQQNFYAVFDLPSGRYTGLGTCTLSSNNVPQAGLVLAGCTLNVVSGPNGVLGGVITSASTFNPVRLPGFSTGSLWTLAGVHDGAGSVVAVDGRRRGLPCCMTTSAATRRSSA